MRKLPLILAFAPWASLAVSSLARLSVFDWLRPIADPIAMAFQLGPALLFKPWIPWSFIGGTPQIFGSPFLALVLYTLTSSAALFGIGVLVSRLF